MQLAGTPDQLQFPNDQCVVGTFTITNGPAADHISLAVSKFTPLDAGVGWSACGPSVRPCRGPTSNGFTRPGANQFAWQSNWGQYFGSHASCDHHSSPLDLTTCPVTAPGEVESDQYTMWGPSSSSDQSPSFSITLSWTALP